MPKKISTKCNVFLQLIILRPQPYFTSHVRKKNPQNHPHFTRLTIRRSADRQIRILPEANSGLISFFKVISDQGFYLDFCHLQLDKFSQFRLILH